MAFLFGVFFPALSVARQAIDPVAYATICRIDTTEQGGSTLPGSLQSKLQSAHCLMCLGTATPPAFDVVEPLIVGVVAELLVSFPRSPWAADDPAAFQPLNPRAPPRA